MIPVCVCVCVSVQLYLVGDIRSSGPITAPWASTLLVDGPCLCLRVQPMDCLLHLPLANQQRALSFSARTERWSSTDRLLVWYQCSAFFLTFFFFFFKCIFLVVVTGGAFSLSHIFDWLSLLFVMFIVLSEGETSLTDPNPPGVTTRDAAHTDGTAEDQKVRRGCVNRNHNKK